MLSTAWTIQALFQPHDFTGAIGSSTLLFQLRAALLISSDNIIYRAFLYLSSLHATAVPGGATVLKCLSLCSLLRDESLLAI